MAKKIDRMDLSAPNDNGATPLHSRVRHWSGHASAYRRGSQVVAALLLLNILLAGNDVASEPGAQMQRILRRPAPDQAARQRGMENRLGQKTSNVQFCALRLAALSAFLAAERALVPAAS